jgi:hypothetical protein
LAGFRVGVCAFSSAWLAAPAVSWLHLGLADYRRAICVSIH